MTPSPSSGRARLALALPAAPAGAHSGGRAQLYVDSIRLEPQADGWLAALVVRDADSGRPEPGFGVQVTGSGAGGAAVGPVSLADPDADGRYVGLVPMTEGGWALTVEADEIPGGPRALPFRKTWAVTLQAGQPLDLAGSRPPTEDGGAGPRTVPDPRHQRSRHPLRRTDPGPHPGPQEKHSSTWPVSLP